MYRVHSTSTHPYTYTYTHTIASIYNLSFILTYTSIPQKTFLNLAICRKCTSREGSTTCITRLYRYTINTCNAMYVRGHRYNIVILLRIRIPIILLFMNSLMPRDIAVKGAIQATRAIAPRNIRYVKYI